MASPPPGQFGSSAPAYQQPPQQQQYGQPPPQQQQQQYGQPAPDQHAYSPPAQHAYSPPAQQAFTPPVQGGTPIHQGGHPAPPAPATHHSHVMDGTTPVVGGPGRGPVQNWQYGFCDFLSPFNTCCLGYWCPCILFGKTQQRIKDPALQNYETVNGNCMGWAALGYCGCFWILQMIKRGEMREQYNIDGSGAGDCFGAYCCPLCGLMQEEKEVIHRTQGAAPVPVTAAQGYQKNESTMQYGGQNPQP